MKENDDIDDPKYGWYIRILSKKIKYLADENLAKHNVTLEQVKVLSFLERNEEKISIYQKDIEKEFGIRRSSVTNILKNMEKNEFVMREIDSKDARIKKVFLTEKGRALSRSLYEHMKEMESKIVGGMEEEEKKMFLKLLKQALNNIDTLM